MTNFTLMKGVNEYSDNDTYIIMTMLSNDHYAILNTLGQYIGDAGIIETYYRDLVSQAIGRNTGYRDSGNGRQAFIIAGPKLIRAGYFENDAGDSNDLTMIREFITYPCLEKPWLKNAGEPEAETVDGETGAVVESALIGPAESDGETEFKAVPVHVQLSTSVAANGTGYLGSVCR